MNPGDKRSTEVNLMFDGLCERFLGVSVRQQGYGLSQEFSDTQAGPLVKVVQFRHIRSCQVVHDRDGFMEKHVDMRACLHPQFV